MDALTRYTVKQRLTSLLKEAGMYQSAAPQLTAQKATPPAPQTPLVSQGVVNAGTVAPTLVPPPPGKGSPMPMAPMTPTPPKSTY